jgi:hypothetical protein
MDSVDLEVGNIINVTNNENNNNNIWKSCCFRVDKNALKYFVQISILSSLIVFSSVMLVVKPDCESQKSWGSILTFCLGVVIEAPKFNK